jgi:hypothetical protein
MLLLTAASVFSQVSWDRSCSLTTFAGCNSSYPGTDGYLKLIYDHTTGKTLHFGIPAGASKIYSSDFYHFDSSTRTFSLLAGDQSLPTDCVGTSTFFADRHPVWQMAVDTSRNRLYLAGGLNNQTCGGELTDTWYLPLSASPSVPVPMTQVVTANFFSADINGKAAMDYDAENDVIFLFGGSYNTNHWLFCPSSTGTATATQTAAGCTSVNNWIQITNAMGNDGTTNCSTGGSAGYVSQCPPGVYYPGMKYLAAAGKFIVFGGSDTADSIHYNQLWEFDLDARRWLKRCVSGCTNPPMHSTTEPPYPMMATHTTGDKVYYHQFNGVGGPQTHVYDYSDNAWSVLITGGSSAFGSMVYEGATGNLVYYGGENGGGANPPTMWVATIDSATAGFRGMKGKSRLTGRTRLP